MQQVRALEISEVSLRNAALIRRACAPTVVSPISPSSSAFVTSAATESSTITSSAFERTSVSQMRSASSPELGCETSRSSRFTPSLPRILRIERVLDVDERRETAALLRLGDDGERQRRFARRFRSENFDDAAARKSADAERAIDQDVAGGNDIDVDDLVVAEPHDRAVAVILGDLLDREIEVFVARGCDFVFSRFFFSFRGHRSVPLRTSPVGLRQVKNCRPERKRRNRGSPCGFVRSLASLEMTDKEKAATLTACGLPPYTRSKFVDYATAILRGFTCSAFGRVQRHDALLDLRADFAGVDRWIELECASEIFRARFAMEQSCRRLSGIERRPIMVSSLFSTHISRFFLVHARHFHVAACSRRRFRERSPPA